MQTATDVNCHAIQLVRELRNNNTTSQNKQWYEQRLQEANIDEQLLQQLASMNDLELHNYLLWSINNQCEKCAEYGPEKRHDYLFKIVLLGNMSVGKSRLLNRMIYFV